MNNKIDVLIGMMSGTIAAIALDTDVIIPILASLLVPFLKDFGNEIVIPYFKKKFKLIDKRKRKEDE
jgi:hypothetical protein